MINRRDVSCWIHIMLDDVYLCVLLGYQRVDISVYIVYGVCPSFCGCDDA